jgi:hypothetical protein
LRNQRRAGDHGEPRLFQRLDDFKLKARLALHPRHEFAAIAGTAAGFGRHQPHPCDLVALEFLLANAQRLQGAVMELRESRPDFSRPAPSCTDFEKLSTTLNWLPSGRATSIRQLFVPRSSAA